MFPPFDWIRLLRLEYFAKLSSSSSSVLHAGTQTQQLGTGTATKYQTYNLVILSKPLIKIKYGHFEIYALCLTNNVQSRQFAVIRHQTREEYNILCLGSIVLMSSVFQLSVTYQLVVFMCSYTCSSATVYTYSILRQYSSKVLSECKIVAWHVLKMIKRRQRPDDS